MKFFIFFLSIFFAIPVYSIKKALIFGITGQDGAYLAEFLLEKGYEVHGVKRRSSSFNTQRIDHLYHDFHSSDNKLILHYGDLADSANIAKLIQEIQPEQPIRLSLFQVAPYRLDGVRTSQVDVCGFETHSVEQAFLISFLRQSS